MERPIPTILFLHGALGTSAELAPLMHIMEEKGFPCASFNFRGHGKNATMPESFRIDQFAQELEHYLKQHRPKHVVAFGHSMGGYVALYHKANYDDSPFEAIFAYGTKFNWSESSVHKELNMLNPDHLVEKFPAYALALNEKHGENWKHLMKNTAHLMQNLERLDGLTREDLHDIHIPVVLLLGDQDRMVTSEETLSTAAKLPKSQVKTISHSKHEMERANLKEISSILTEFLR